MAPQLIFGTATFGMDLTEFQDPTSVNNLLTTIKGLSINRLDTAARYPPLNPGRSEQLLGETSSLSDPEAEFSIDTKVYTNTRTDGSGDLTREAIAKSVETSLERLGRPQGVNILYAHRPDPATPLEEQIQAFNEQVALGHCKAWGVSNFPPAVLEEILVLCEQNGWQKPSHYQGAYNAVTRGIETKLLPHLRAHGISFVGYTVLAAGFLTGKLVNNEHSETRAGDRNPLGKAIQARFSSESLHAAVKRFDSAVKAQGLTPVEVAIRWVTHHSVLGDGDAIILGASKISQIKETVELIHKGPLPQYLVTITEELWDEVKESREGMDNRRVGRGYQPQTRDNPPPGTLAERCVAAAVDFAPKQISGSQVYNRPATISQRKHDNDELGKLRADIRDKDEQIKALRSEIMAREGQSKTELDEKMAVAQQRAEQEMAELRKDVAVLKSLQDDLWAENSSLKAEKRTQKKALADYHVLYSLQKAYDTHYRKLDWRKQRAAEHLHAKYKRADCDAVAAAYELYEFLEDNGMDDTLKLDPDLKKSLRWMAEKKDRRS
ncbi:hypothetical protein VPNG_04868 [Cytospora leucostoma]|uniref:NADP-dependent oxidoreductase domain-containing protein n=1 Tax=Cytospora leucostoma TaxID=1230097 RepID=A0A423XB94_9PEZI|nr:hypothetical protein VPNG_04868 [Cytospora leucostoma]